MSLFVDEGRRRGRSKSPSGRRREDREKEQIVEAREPSYAYPEDDLDDTYKPSRRKDDQDRERGYRSGAGRGASGGALPYPEDERGTVMPGSFDFDDRPSKPTYRTVSPPPESTYRSSREKVDDDRARYGDRGEKEYRRSKRDKDDDKDDKLQYLPQKYSRKQDAEGSGKPSRDSERDHDQGYGRRRQDDDKRGYGRQASPPPSPRDERDRRGYVKTVSPTSPRRDSPPRYAYAQPKQYEYAKVDEKIIAKYSQREQDDSPDRKGPGRAPSPEPAYTSSVAKGKTYNRGGYGDPRASAPSVLTVEPGSRTRERSRDRRGAQDRGPQPPVSKMSSLSVNTGHHSLNMSLASGAPASPLLESYHGTYQSMSPMPSPLLLASQGPGDGAFVQDVSPLNSDDDDRGDGKKRNRRARFHDPEDIASRLAKALKGDKAPNTEPLIEILPGLTHGQVMELRAEYKALVKTGSDRKGVNVAKHIRARLKDEDPNLMKACYSVALGQWESEAYWANFWYQGDKTRRELLIEALMGRTNDEIRRIKDGFNDKKYDNSLTKCMKTELKEDKFKKAVLLVLAEDRMEDVDSHGRPLAIDMRLVDQDVDDLRRAIKAEKGGESLMISIVVQRSDAHLREVLKLYERDFKSNFARDALKKSGNLVGELLAHILNGVINKPVRDALLLHHALTASKKDGLRRELLISRLVRYHWDRRHMAAVKRAYRERYGRDLQEAVRDGTSGEWGLFCRELCISRMPDDVRRVERVEVIRSRD